MSKKHFYINKILFYIEYNIVRLLSKNKRTGWGTEKSSGLPQPPIVSQGDVQIFPES